jgi:hypothetical protein
MTGTPPGPGEAAPAAKPQEPPQPPAKPNLSGTWKFNRDQSDDAQKKMQEARGSNGSSGGNGGNTGGNGGNGPYGSGGGGRMGGGWPGGGGGIGGGGGGMGGGRGGSGGRRGNGGNDQNSEGRETMHEIMNPADSLTIAQAKDSAPEIDLTDEQNRKRVFYTDGRKLQKSKDDKYQEEAALWQDGRLVAYIAEKRGAIKRTFEVAPGGEQLIETVQLPARQQQSGQSGQSDSPVVIRFVYDLVRADKQ